ncbi:MAG TPA: HAD-IA family hydrolase [Candidatus Babeliales bacterium]|nr:HAD-IA family hydrolase [Candidatus Babeliales bacterium]
MKMRHLLALFIATLSLCCPFVSAQNMVFDFGGVLFHTNQYVSFTHLGMMNVAELAIRQGISPGYLSCHIKTTLFKTLDAIAQKNNLDATQYHQTYDEKGNPLPLLMCAWLQGHMTCSEIRALIDITLAQHIDWFTCHAEQRIIRNLLYMIFTPEHFVDSQKLSPAAFAFVKRCKKEGHKIYGLSNWDPESFALLKDRHPKLFELFDGIIISGHVKANKPHPPIYHALLNQYQLEPQQCWFIDDQKENVEAAQKIGINAVVHTACFKTLVKTMQLSHSKSARRENFNNSGIKETTTNTANSTIIDGEKISLTDSTIYSCLPAKA